MGWEEGIYMASTLGSESTSASNFRQGIIRIDPFAMLPFCGYNMSKYFKNWINLGIFLKKNNKKLPKIFFVNWFLKKKNKFIWPGFKENSRVLKWIILRIENKVGGFSSSVGLIPRYKDIDWSGYFFSKENFNFITKIKRKNFLYDIMQHDNFFKN